jgi:hypothetical protein
MHGFKMGETLALVTRVANHHANFVLPALNALSLVAKESTADLPADTLAGETALQGLWL